MRKFIFIIFIPISFSCSVSRSVYPSIESFQNQTVSFVPLRKLLTERDKYHGQVVETEGHFSFGFERSALYYDSVFSFSDGSLHVRMYGDALWIEMHPKHPYYFRWPDTLQDKVIRVRGTVDTSHHGHTGMYTAGLLNVYYMNSRLQEGPPQTPPQEGL